MFTQTFHESEETVDNTIKQSLILGVKCSEKKLILTDGCHSIEAERIHSKEQQELPRRGEIALFNNCFFSFIDEEKGRFRLRFQSWSVLMPRVKKREEEWEEVRDLNSLAKEEDIEFIRRNLQKNQFKKGAKFLQVSDLLTASSVCDDQPFPKRKVLRKIEPLCGNRFR